MVKKLMFSRYQLKKKFESTLLCEKLCVKNKKLAKTFSFLKLKSLKIKNACYSYLRSTKYTSFRIKLAGFRVNRIKLIDSANSLRKKVKIILLDKSLKVKHFYSKSYFTVKKNKNKLIKAFKIYSRRLKLFKYNLLGKKTFNKYKIKAVTNSFDRVKAARMVKLVLSIFFSDARNLFINRYYHTYAYFKQSTKQVKIVHASHASMKFLKKFSKYNNLLGTFNNFFFKKKYTVWVSNGLLEKKTIKLKSLTWTSVLSKLKYLTKLHQKLGKYKNLRVRWNKKEIHHLIRVGVSQPRSMKMVFKTLIIPYYMFVYEFDSNLFATFSRKTVQNMYIGRRLPYLFRHSLRMLDHNLFSTRRDRVYNKFFKKVSKLKASKLGFAQISDSYISKKYQKRYLTASLKSKTKSFNWFKGVKKSKNRTGSYHIARVKKSLYFIKKKFSIKKKVFRFDYKYYKFFSKHNYNSPKKKAKRVRIFFSTKTGFGSSFLRKVNRRVPHHLYTCLRTNRAALEKAQKGKYRHIFNQFEKDTVTEFKTKKLAHVYSQFSTRLLRTDNVVLVPGYVLVNVVTNSYDVVHSWFVPGLGIKMDCVPGRSTHHTFYFNCYGVYFGQCAEICGRFHHHMPIKVAIVRFNVFKMWILLQYKFRQKFYKLKKKPLTKVKVS